MKFSRIWKWNNQLLESISAEQVEWKDPWKTDGESECTYIDNRGSLIFPERTTFRPGPYTLELEIEGDLEAVGYFTVE